MTLSEWKALDEATRGRLALGWVGYDDGYWHALARSVAEDLWAELGHPPWIHDVQSGTHHGGTIVITVVTSFSPGDRLPVLPSCHLGIPVIPTLFGKGEYPRYLSGGPDAT